MPTARPQHAVAADAPERRTLPRIPLHPVEQENWCALRTGKGESATVQVLDITSEGCRLQIAANPESACLARLEYGDWLEFLDWTCAAWNGPLQGMRAEVVWVEGRELGCRFERRLRLDELQHQAACPAGSA